MYQQHIFCKCSALCQEGVLIHDYGAKYRFPFDQVYNSQRLFVFCDVAGNKRKAVRCILLARVQQGISKYCRSSCLKTYLNWHLSMVTSPPCDIFFSFLAKSPVNEGSRLNHPSQANLLSFCSCFPKSQDTTLLFHACQGSRNLNFSAQCAGSLALAVC